MGGGVQFIVQIPRNDMKKIVRPQLKKLLEKEFSPLTKN